MIIQTQIENWFSVEQNGTAVSTTISLALPIDNNTVTISKREVECDLEFTIHRSLTYNETANTGLVCTYVVIELLKQLWNLIKSRR